ncbi:flavin-containing monooxygenase [Thermogemmatispora sp.]|uniref:flavin-containing monooxygenase n=1 Tax=Thermogemmatispora sp. TaxID=1968838 RepID=UPI0035E41B92
MAPRYCIIGAGYSGLGIARAFQEAGIAFDIFEKNDDVGGNWLNGVYDATHIISSRNSTGYEEYPMPASYPDFPSRQQVLDYLRAYADHYGLRRYIQFGRRVERLEPLDQRGLSGWRVTLDDGRTLEYQGVIVANGHHWDRRYPRYPGHFSGKTLHSKDYKNADDLEGESILVVGAGNSGCDIAVEGALCKRIKHVAISMRRGYYFLPKTIAGIPVAEMEMPWMPLWLQKLIIKAALALIVGPNSRYGLPKPDHDLFDRHPIVNSQLLYFIRHGLISPKPDIARLDGKRVHFVDGSSQEFDTIVWATGFNVSFPFLDQNLFTWEHGYPRLVAHLLVPGLANLYIFGLLQPRGGAGPLISRGARLLVDLVQCQERLETPIVEQIARWEPPSARYLVGVQETMRSIERLRRRLRGLAPRARGGQPGKLSGNQSQSQPQPAAESAPGYAVPAAGHANQS